MKTGRPTIYTKELADKICLLLADGDSLLKISKRDEMPSRSTIHEWLLDETKKEFSDSYEKAVNIRTENMFDELENIADISDTIESPMRSRLRVDTRKWYLSKVMPKKYGDKIDMTSGGKELPKPLLYVLNNLSNKENSETKEED